MPYPQPLSRLTFSGIHGAGEIFSFGFHVGLPSAGVFDMDAIEDAARAFMSSGNSGFAGAADLTEIKYAGIGPDGRYTSDSDPQIRELDPPESGGGGAFYTPQSTMVVTLDTGRKRGLAHAGRFYCPPTSFRADNNGLLAPEARNGLLANAKTFLDDVNAALTGGRIVVASNRGAGAEHTVMSIRVGRVIDTQRRRRNALNEDYASAGLE